MVAGVVRGGEEGGGRRRRRRSNGGGSERLQVQYDAEEVAQCESNSAQLRLAEICGRLHAEGGD